MSTRKPSATSSQKRIAAQRSAAARERIKQAQRRRQFLLVGSVVLAIVLIVGVLVVVKVVSGAGSNKSGAKARAASTSIVTKIANVPTRVLNQVGAGDTVATPLPMHAPPLTANGKPEIFYMGAEFCPYCGAERWAFALALDRFGTLHNLGQTVSSPTDVPASIQTLTFHGASYTSNLLALTAKEVESNQVVNGAYAPLDKLTPAERSLVAKYDAKPYVPSAGIPFIDFGGKYVIAGATYDIQLLSGKTRTQIANALSDPTSTVGRAVDGAANGLTAAMCTLTHEQPGAVCSSPGVQAAARTLPNAGAAPRSTGAGSSSAPVGTLSPSAGG